MKHYPDQDVSDNRRSVRRRARQLEQRQRRALREQGQQLLELGGPKWVRRLLNEYISSRKK